MELTHEFEVGVPLQEAWAVLTDLERIAPCMPGAQLQEVEGDEYRGTVKVKVGPITAQYKGKATFAELDQAARRAVLVASGRDTKGQGNASATVSAQLSDVGGRTQVNLVTDLNLTGKVAQFGRGVLGDVSGKLMGQFVDNLEATVLDTPPEQSLPADSSPPMTSKEPSVAPDGPPASPADDGQEGIRTVDSPEVEPVDLLDTAGTPVLKRVVPLVVVAVLLVVVVRILRRRR
jgi:uncharacterized protein